MLICLRIYSIPESHAYEAEIPGQQVEIERLKRRRVVKRSCENQTNPPPAGAAARRLGSRWLSNGESLGSDGRTQNSLRVCVFRGSLERTILLRLF